MTLTSTLTNIAHWRAIVELSAWESIPSVQKEWYKVSFLTKMNENGFSISIWYIIAFDEGDDGDQMMEFIINEPNNGVQNRDFFMWVDF